MTDSTSFPTHMAYYIDNGYLKKTPRYGAGYADITLPDNYALVYTKQIGTIASPNTVIKVFIIKKDNNNGNDIKEFYSSKYGNIPKNLREAVEFYIKEQLSNPQQTLITRKHKLLKSKTKRKMKCKCHK
jgi:hypothetical protein